MNFARHCLIVLLACFAINATAQPQGLNSYAIASATVFIDFDGQYVTGTAWNYRGDIYAAASGLSNNAITEIIGRVSEDYRPFNLNITTDSAVYWLAPRNKRMRIIVTPTSQWYGAAGGVAYVGSFTWGDNTPAWVFSALLNNNPKWVAEAISHEMGHTLGLQHQSSYDANCNKIAEYNTGLGTGEIGWAPIMGAGYYQNHTTWHIGPNTVNCGTLQNDFNIISNSNGFGLRPDDHGDGISDATPVNIFGDNFSVAGLINTATDVDVFKILLDHPTTLKLNAIPQNVGSGDDGANVDIKLTLMNGVDTINSYNPSTLLNAGIDTNLNAGTYYLLVDGVGNIYHNDIGSIGLYNLSGYIVTALPLSKLQFSGVVQNNKHVLSWSYQTDEAIEKVIIESSADGKRFSALTEQPATATKFSYAPLSSELIYYRLKIATANQREYISAIITLKNRVHTAGLGMVNGNGAEIIVNSADAYIYRLLTSSGQLIQAGRLQTGINYIPSHAAKGLLFLNCSNGYQSFT